MIIVLTGYGRDTKKEKSITCTSEQADTQRSLKLYATDDIVDKLTLEITIPESTSKKLGLTKVSKEDLKMLGSGLL